MSDLREKYPSMYEGEEKKDIADLQEEEPVSQELPNKPKGEMSLPLHLRGAETKGEAREHFKKQRLEAFDQDAESSDLPDWLISGLRGKLERELDGSPSVYDIKDSGVYTLKSMLSQLSMKFPDIERLSKKYPSMGTPQEVIEEYLKE